MGKKNKKNKNDPKENENPNKNTQDEKGASGSNQPGDKKKDSAQGSSSQLGETKPQQQQKKKGQQGEENKQTLGEHQVSTQQQQPKGTWGQSSNQKQQGQQPSGSGQPKQQQGGQSKQSSKQHQGSDQRQQPQQQPQAWSQKGPREQQRSDQRQQPQQPPQTWGQQGPREQQRSDQRQQPQQPPQAWGQQGPREQQRSDQRQQPQPPPQAWSQQAPREQQRSDQRQQPQQAPQAWGQQGPRKQQRSDQRQQPQPPPQAWSQQAPREQQRSDQRQQPQGGQQQPSQTWSRPQPQQQGPRQQYQQRPEQGRGQPRQQSSYQQQAGQYQQRGPMGQPDTELLLPPPQFNTLKRGTLGKPFKVQTNYITLDLKNMPDVAYHYDVKIEPDRPQKFVRRAFELYIKQVFPDCHVAYDGKANAYSPVLLPEKILNANQGVEVKVIEEIREIPFKVSLQPTDDIKIDLKSLKTYQNDRIFDKPMRALQCLEVVLASPCHEKGVRAGRSFFYPPPQNHDLGDGFELWFGLYQAAILGDQPLLNVDVSHKSFPSEVKLDTYYENLRRQTPAALEEFLKGLRVIYTPPAVFKSVPKGFKFLKVMGPSSKQQFKLEDGTQMTVEKYFESKKAPLRKPDYPCLHVGSSVKNIYIPLEFLTVPPGQAILRKDNENQVRQMIRFAATSTDARKEKIMRLLQHFNYNRHATVERFGLSVGNQFITVPARLLTSPAIEYAGKSITIDRPGEWMMKNVNFLKCDKRVIHQWAIINISRNRDINEMFIRENFITSIEQMARKVGMSLSSKCFQIIEPKGFGNSIKSDLNKLKASKVSIVFVILPFNKESYAIVKQEAELSCGIVTQCIKGETMRKRNGEPINAMTVSNILLKVNAKLNGTNHKIAQPNEIQFQRTSKVMFVGADVSHPSPLQKNLPSIVGVVASHDLFGTQYNMQYRLQTPGVETIADMKDIFTQHLNVFKAHNGALPDYIIYYRDGVSDGQFQIIEQVEVAAMRAACRMANCKAKFTCIIVVKRHHTRFFPKNSDGEGKFNNVKAGTVVDRSIVHPNEVQFFMVSHKAIQGTSKPTRYNVIVDDAKLDIDDLQTMTYNLCHLFPRCNRSVSYPAPAYLAHLVGLRGRAYIEGSNLNLDNLKAEYSKRLVSNDVMQGNPMYFV